MRPRTDFCYSSRSFNVQWTASHFLRKTPMFTTRRNPSLSKSSRIIKPTCMRCLVCIYCSISRTIKRTPRRRCQERRSNPPTHESMFRFNAIKKTPFSKHSFPLLFDSNRKSPSKPRNIPPKSPINKPINRDQNPIPPTDTLGQVRSYHKHPQVSKIVPKHTTYEGNKRTYTSKETKPPAH